MYNAFSGAVIRVGRRVAKGLTEMAASGDLPPDADLDVRQLVPHLLAGGFLVSRSADERAAVERRFDVERKEAPVLLTVIPTWACNLSCHYCFVGPRTGTMSLDVQDALVRFAEDVLEVNRPRRMSVDWLGGEPLLSWGVVDRVSAALLEVASRRAVPYGSQLISNGTLLGRIGIEDLRRNAIDRIQVTLDGPGPVQDRRRPYRTGGRSSFDSILGCLAPLVGKVEIRLRVNCDRTNEAAIWALLDVFEEQGWLGRDTRFFPYLGRVSPFTGACASVAETCSTVEEFAELQLGWVRRLFDLGVPVLFQGLYGFPSPKPYHCGAVSDRAFIVGPDGNIHVCGLQATDTGWVVGNVLRTTGPADLDKRRWAPFRAFAHDECAACSSLPSCLGGCPRNRLEGRERDLQDTCLYHRRIEDRLIALHVDLASMA